MQAQVKREVLLKDVGISLPALFEPAPYMENGVPKGEAKYSMSAVVTPEQAKLIETKAKEIIAEKFGKDAVGVYGKPGGIRPVCRDGSEIADEQAKKGKNLEFLRGHHQFRAASGAKMPPLVVSTDVVEEDGKRKWRPITKDEGVASGSRGNVSITLSSYEYGQNMGVTAYLGGVQVTERWSRDANGMFGEAPVETDANPFAGSEY